MNTQPDTVAPDTTTPHECSGTPNRPRRVVAGSDRGTVTVFVAVVATALVMVAGMAYDGGQIITHHAQARSHAQKAARAGAQHINLDALRTTGTTAIDHDAARNAAHDYLTQVGVGGSVEITDATVTVTVTVHTPMLILPIADREITVTHAATATDHQPVAP